MKFIAVNLITFLVFSLNPKISFGYESDPVEESNSPMGKMKAMPKKVSDNPDIIVEWVETIDECSPEKICVQGGVYNQGRNTGYNVKLKVEIGGSKNIRPRTSLFKTVDSSTMNSGDRQDFTFELDRKVTYQDRGKEKTIDVGKYNFKVFAVWDIEKPTKKKAREKPQKRATRE